MFYSLSGIFTIYNVIKATINNYYNYINMLYNGIHIAKYNPYGLSKRRPYLHFRMPEFGKLNDCVFKFLNFVHNYKYIQEDFFNGNNTI